MLWDGEHKFFFFFFFWWVGVVLDTPTLNKIKDDEWVYKPLSSLVLQAGFVRVNSHND